MLNEPLFSFGFCGEGINCSSHNESPKPSGFGIFNSSSCSPIKSDGTSLYCESDSVPAIPVHFWHSSPTLSQGQSEKQSQTEARPPSSFRRYLRRDSIVPCPNTSNAPVPSVGNRGPRTEGQDARAGDQWMVPEMWLSPCVGIGSRKNVSGTKRKPFQPSLTPKSCSSLPPFN